MNIVSLVERNTEKAARQALERQARLRIFREDYAWFPEDYEVEPRTGIARFNPEDWSRLTAFFALFTLDVPYTAHFEALLATWSHLWEKYGCLVDYKLNGPVTYRALTSDWSAKDHAFIDALIDGNSQKIRRTGEALGFFEEVQRIIGARDIVNERGPAIRLDGLPEELAEAVAGPGAAYVNAPGAQPVTAKRSTKKRPSAAKARPALRLVG